MGGYLTGMVVTAKVTDATPACFASHVVNRAYENAIAEQLIGNGPLNRTLDLLFGGISPKRKSVTSRWTMSLFAAESYWIVSF